VEAINHTRHVAHPTYFPSTQELVEAGVDSITALAEVSDETLRELGFDRNTRDKLNFEVSIAVPCRRIE